MINKLLIANRGEIACRIMRTAHTMGIETVAVYSDADENAQHRLMAGEAVHIGPAPVAESYLRADKIISAASETGAEAIHPGYGFLSENPDFVEKVEKAGLIFLGPSASAIRAMGLKDAAKKLMADAKVPIVPGYHGENQDPQFLESEAGKIGYPVLIKARAGGGGKGMRKVDRADQFQASLESAVREAEASFGDGAVLIEKFISSPRHIEVQVFGDNHGNVVHLFERDCSLQRRHQKVIEEAPAPGMTEEMREAMGSAAVKAAQAINYAGAGTVEFIVDGSDGLSADKFWFMEMNTRLQVEHPVTEAITGVDLVEWQIRVANDEYLPMFQDELSINGHAFEARLYAEDVPKGFLPATGTLEYLEFSDAARNDSGVVEGDTITPFYDPMIAKIITHSDDRADALSKLDEALSETKIAGTVTNREFMRALCNNEDFANARVDTGLIEREIDALTAPIEPKGSVIALAAKYAMGLPAHPNLSGENDWADDPFDTLAGFANWRAPIWTQSLKFDGSMFDVKIRQHGGLWQCMVIRDGIESSSWFSDTECVDFEAADEVVVFGNKVAVFGEEATFEFEIPDRLKGTSQSESSGNAVRAPMPGLVRKLFAQLGANVQEGDPLIVLEAMKMEHTLTSPRDGVIGSVNTSEGDQVEDGDLLVALEEPDE